MDAEIAGCLCVLQRTASLFQVRAFLIGLYEAASVGVKMMPYKKCI